ncbi:hypothetical protein AB1L88_26375 [Tautonia sp. JC769]|uniref:hypothetical protein n=1 Tax=Tautonia sp. JC769 TaxID=3232135 RepID=UPI003457DF9E
MGFAESDWRHLTSRMAWVEGRLKAKGATVRSPDLMPPVDRAQVDAFSDRTGLRLPQDLIDLVTGFAGGWSFSWNLGVAGTDRWLRPGVDVGAFGGNGEVPFLGASRETTLLDLYQQFQEEIHDTFFADAGDAESLRRMPSVFPLHLFEGGGGDSTVLRLDTSPCEVVFLDHEKTYRIDEGQVIGRGLGDFLRRWANVGFVSCEYLDVFIDAEGRDIDDVGIAAREWIRWLDDPEAA